MAKILREGDYSYDQSNHLIAEARKAVGLKPPKRKPGSARRLTAEEVDKLLETATRVSAFCRLRVRDIAFQEREIRVCGKGDKKREIPVLQSLLNELRLHLDGRESGYLFPSPRGATTQSGASSRSSRS